MVGGLSAITRCDADLNRDGFTGSINYNADDRFCLDGQRLVAISGTYGASGTQYRTDPDTFTKVISFGNNNGHGPTYFRAWTKDGEIREYGLTNNSAIEHVTYAPTDPATTLPNQGYRVWAVDQISDHVGRSMSFTYQKDVTGGIAASGEYWLDNIAYTHWTNYGCPGEFGCYGLPSGNQISFSYADRPLSQQYTTYEAGQGIIHKKELTKMTTYANSGVVHNFNLTYDQASQRARLKTVQQCDNAGVCLPATSITWQDRPAPSLSYDGSMPYTYSAPATSHVWTFFDLTHNWELVNTFDKTFVDEYTGAVVSVHHDSLAFGKNTHLGTDANNDGFGDATVIHPTPDGLNGTASNFEKQPADAQFSALSTGSGVGSWDELDTVYEQGDFNGDGRTDLIRLFYDENANVTSATIYAGQPNGGYSQIGSPTSLFNEPIRYSDGFYNWIPNMDAMVTELNGDGKADLLFYNSYSGTGGTQRKVLAFLSTGTGFTAYPLNFTVVPGQPDIIGNYDDNNSVRRLVGDYNGDGLSDLAIVTFNGGALSTMDVYLSTPHNTTKLTKINTSAIDLPITFYQDISPHPAEWVYPFVVDFNGDGRSDIMMIGDVGGQAGVKVFLSNGRGDQFDSKPTQNTFNLGANTWDPNLMHSFLPGDYNGDGFTDLLYLHRTVTNPTAVLFLGRGRGNFNDNIFDPGITMPNPSLGAGNNDAAYLPSDINGDGKTDLVWMNGQTGNIDYDYNLITVDGSGQAYAQQTNTSDIQIRPIISTPGIFDVVKTVTDGYGKATNITYANGTDSAVYHGHGADIPSDTYGHSQSSSAPVVQQYTTPNGVGGVYTMTMNYSGRRTNPVYGPEGFGQTESYDIQHNRTDDTTYLQPYPFTGKVANQQTTISGNIVSSHAQTWGQIASSPARVVMSSEEMYENDLSSGLEKNHYIKSYLFDPYDQPMDITTTWFDPSGTFDGHSQEEEIQYQNDVPNWSFGLPSLNRTTETVNGASSARTVTRVYNFWTQLQTERQEWTEASGTKFRQSDFVYGDYGNRTQTTVTGSGLTPRIDSATYEPFGRSPLTTTNAKNQITNYVYDPRFGLATKITDPNGVSTTTTYDNFGRKAVEKRADQSTTNWTYCQLLLPAPLPANFNHLVSVYSTAKPSVTTYYDVLDRPIRVQTDAFDGQQIYQDTSYNGRLQMSAQTDPYLAGATPVTHSWTYDLLDRKTHEFLPGGGGRTWVYGPSGSLATNPLYPNTETSGGSVTEIDALAMRTNQIFDRRGNVIQVSQTPTGPGPQTRITRLYDGFNNLTGLANGQIITTTNAYDELGRMIGTTDVASGTQSMTYSAVDETLTHTNASGTQTMTYDELGRMLTRTEPEGTTQWTYDTAANGIGLIDRIDGPASDQHETHTYDTLGRPLTTTVTNGSQSFPTSWTYGPASRIDTMTYPGATPLHLQYSYTDTGYPQSIKTTDIPGTVYWTINSQNAYGQPLTGTWGNGLVTTWTYDNNRRKVQTIQTINSLGGAQVQSLGYTYNNEADMLTRTDNRINSSESILYDPLRRINAVGLTVNGSANGTTNFGADTYGSLSQRGGTGVLTYNPISPYQATSVATSSGPSAITYNGKGDVLSGLGRAWTWTSFDQPASVSDGTTSTTIQTGPDRTISKKTTTTGGNTVTTFYGGPVLERDTNSSGRIEDRNYIMLDGMTMAIVRQPASGSPQTYYLHRDALGSVEAITDQSGNVVERQTYDAFGAQRNLDWTPASAPTPTMFNLGYGGYERLTPTGAIQMGARVYDPQLGRMLSADSVIPDMTNAQTYNSYSYAINSPLSYVDPSGHGPCPPDDPNCDGTTDQPVTPRVVQSDEAGKFAEVEQTSTTSYAPSTPPAPLPPLTAKELAAAKAVDFVATATIGVVSFIQPEIGIPLGIAYNSAVISLKAQYDTVTPWDVVAFLPDARGAMTMDKKIAEKTSENLAERTLSAGTEAGTDLVKEIADERLQYKAAFNALFDSRRGADNFMQQTAPVDNTAAGVNVQRYLNATYRR